MSRYRSPLSRARGLGSAKEGVGHWWFERVTAATLIPLLVWLALSLALLGKADYASLTAWISKPYNAVLLLALIPTLFYHSALGIQVIAEDYIATKGLRLSLIVLSNCINSLLAIISIFAVFKIALGINT